VIELGLMPTAAATLLWNWGMARVPASNAAVFVNLEPVVGAILGMILFREAFGVLSIAGGVLIVVSSVVVSLRPVRSRSPRLS
jgi:drug/metabolite transporter (DMT)-like permease